MYQHIIVQKANQKVPVVVQAPIQMLFQILKEEEFVLIQKGKILI